MGKMGQDRDVDKMNPRNLIPYINNFQNTTVAIIGDIIADHYIWGKVERISPEAPVPIVDVNKENFMLGGAGNVANNILSLGGSIIIGGVVGNDEMGEWIINTLRTQGVDTTGIAVEEGRPTTRKTRVIAHSQHVVRFDRESRERYPNNHRRLSLDLLRIIRRPLRFLSYQIMQRG